MVGLEAKFFKVCICLMFGTFKFGFVEWNVEILAAGRTVQAEGYVRPLVRTHNQTIGRSNGTVAASTRLSSGHFYKLQFPTYNSES